MNVVIALVAFGIIVAFINQSARISSLEKKLKSEAQQNQVRLMDKLEKSSETLEKALKLDILRSQARLIQKVDESTQTTGKQNAQMAERIDVLERRINRSAKAFALLEKQNQELQEKLSFFADIESDSAKLSKVDSVDYETIFDDISLYDLDEEQQQTFHLLQNTNQNLFITGKAGTGKSFLLKYFAKEAQKRVVLLAPTGVSAINIRGATIHSAFGYDNLVSTSLEMLSAATLKLKSEKRQLLQNVDAIIIDEISMVRADVFEKINVILKTIMKSDMPFGGKQMIVFGDLFQLPPVAKQDETKYLKDRFGGIHFFRSDAYSDAAFSFIELTINHRQKEDGAFFDVLNKMREGALSKEDADFLNTRANLSMKGIHRITKLFSTKAKAEALNNEELEKIAAKEYVFQSKVVFSKNNVTPNLENIFPITDRLRLKRGALVMLTQNDPDKRWVNGTQAIVTQIAQDYICVTIDRVKYQINQAVFKQEEAIYKHGRIEYETTCEVHQYPIVLAYGLTIHKAQGLTCEEVACDVSECFSQGQAYVALSRCSNMDGLYLLEPISEDVLCGDKEVKDFYLLQKENAVV